MNNTGCEHIKQVKELKLAGSYVCGECVKTNSNWVHLRTCQSCGITLCCDSSPQKHMTKHFHRTNHPVIISSEPGEQWLWCYADEVLIEY
ncbi:MAG: UBP-type zinc finger domain-containing protein [Chitinophagaceae bacterium]